MSSIAVAPSATSLPQPRTARAGQTGQQSPCPPPTLARVLDRDQVTAGVLVAAVPREVVNEAITVHGAGRRRSDGKLPPHVVVYLLMGLWVFAEEDYEEVATKVTGYLDDLGAWAAPWTPPTASAITQARKRLPAAVMATIFESIAVPLAGPLTPGAWLGTFPGRQRRLVAIDGFELDVPDTDVNEAAFGRAGGGGQHSGDPAAARAAQVTGSAYPKARVVAITECATHAPLAAQIGPFSTGEATLARQLYPQLAPDQVLLADRGFFSYTAFAAAAATGADLIWRAPTNLKLPLVAALPDGSYTSVLFHPEHRAGYSRQAVIDAARAGKALDAGRGMLVRVVDYDISDRSQLAPDGSEQGSECVTLITTILEPDGEDGVDALALARTYAQRWEIETAFDLAKTHLRGPGRMLRSRLPELVTQEIWALLITHYALTSLAARAAEAAGLDPDRVSFDRLLHITRRSATGTAGFPPCALE